MIKQNIKNLAAKMLITASFVATPTMATIVTFDTSEGAIEVNLFDESTPETVENFLNYVNEQAYNDTVIHRSINGFIMQGGGFKYEGSLNLASVESNAAIINEPVWSNRTGTIAMAKLGNQPNSATNEWFFNLANNHANLDLQNEGFTVFGQVTSGMDVIEKIENFSTCGVTGTIFADLPVTGITCASISEAGVENLVTIYSITISDTSIDSAKDLSPVENTLIDAKDIVDDVKDSGGSLGFMSILLLGLVRVFRK